MFRIIDFSSLIKYVAVIIVILSSLIYFVLQKYFFPNFELIKLLTIVPWIAIFVLFLIGNNFISRAIWKVMSFFNKRLYPDLNGEWSGEIITEMDLKIPIKAVIRHNLFSVEIDLHTETSKSVTLEATPFLENGQFKLFYIYRSIPKNPAWSVYTGITNFDIRRLDSLELSGSYFTDRKTIGRILLKQIDKDANKEVSFY